MLPVGLNGDSKYTSALFLVIAIKLSHVLTNNVKNNIVIDIINAPTIKIKQSPNRN